MKYKCWIVFVLVFSLALSLCTGCGKNNDTDPNMPNSSAENGKTDDGMEAKYVYRASYLPLTGPDGTKLDYVNQFCISGDRLFFSASFISGEQTLTDPVTGEPVLDENTGEPITFDAYEDGLFAMDLVSCSIAKVEEQQMRQIPEDFEGDTYVQSMCPGSDGSFWVLQSTNTYYYDLPDETEVAPDQMWEYYREGERYYDLVQFAPDGRFLKTIQLQVPQDVYVGELMISSDGSVIANDWQNIYLFDSEGALISTLTDVQNMGQLARMGDGTIGMTKWTPDYASMVFVPVDPATGESGDEVPLAANVYNLYPGNSEYAYLYMSGDNVYGCREGAETGEKLFSWMECDIDSNNINQFVFLDDGSVAAVEFVWSSEGSTTNVVLMEQMDRSLLPQKRELTVGCIGLDTQLRTLIVDFNRTHSDVRIVVKEYMDYATEGDYEAAVQRLNTEIMSGNAPDMLCLAGLPADHYIAKGILADLWPMIDSDPEISREDLMVHLFDAMSVDGGLYQLTNCFSVQTAAVRSTIAAGRTSWSLEELLEALDNLQPGADIFGETNTKTGVLNQCLSYDLSSYIDWSTRECRFDSPAFRSVLEFANSFSAELDWEDYDWETAESEYARLQNGKQLMTSVYLSDFQELQVQAALHGGDVTYIGLPSESGNGSCFTLGSTISISASCSDPDAAWSFARELLLEENQTRDILWSFPTNKAAFDARVEESMTARYETDPETGEQIEVSQGGIGYGNDFSIDLYALKQKDLDAFMSLYESCNSVYLYDEEIMQMILNECEAFFAGQKTAEETARLIQDRVSLYVIEKN